MTVPTQAQIEAAAKAMMYAQMKCGGTPSMTNGAAEYIAKAALTAAAEVRSVTVGDHKDLAMVENLRDEVARLKDERAATIERCAKIAKAAKERAIEEYRQRIKENDASADYYLWCRDEADEIEAAIRALKDKT